MSNKKILFIVISLFFLSIVLVSEYNTAQTTFTEVVACLDEDNDCICDDFDWCKGSHLGEPVNIHGCDPFQFCSQFICGNSCDKANFFPFMQDCKLIIRTRNLIIEELKPKDCITVIIHNEGTLRPKCVPLTCAD